MLRTTRIPKLDALVSDDVSGGQPLGKALGKTRLKFGNLGSGEMAGLNGEEYARTVFVIARYWAIFVACFRVDVCPIFSEL